MDAAFLSQLNAAIHTPSGAGDGRDRAPGNQHQRLLYLSPVPWHSFAQRSHELVDCFHRHTGGEVLWLDPYPTRLPCLADLRRAATRPPTASENPAWLHRVRPLALPTEPLPIVRDINRLLWRKALDAVRTFARQPTLLIVGKPSRLALQLLRDPLFSDSRYDAMDDVAQFYEGLSRSAMARCERHVVNAAAEVWCSSRELQQRLRDMGCHPSLIPNACAADRLPPPSTTRPHSPAVLGYLGVIAKWFDWQWLIDMARARPDAEIRLIGPQFGPIPTALPGNVRLLPPLAHAQAMQAMSEFDIGLIPFRQSELTRSVDPVKYYEYRAMGLPVISTAFGEMRHRGIAQGVYLATPQTCPNALITRALAHPFEEQQTRRFRQENSWSKRFPPALFDALPGAHGPAVLRPE
ncbi:hypothetical protein [Pseudomonas nicosulfuronedens]